LRENTTFGTKNNYFKAKMVLVGSLNYLVKKLIYNNKRWEDPTHI
jgi:hypothetical protein